METQFFHILPIQKRFSDIDMLGHATNSIYQQYFDLGRLHYFIDVLNAQMNWLEEGLILVSINVNYISQITLYQDIEVRTKVTKLGNKSLEVLQQVFNVTTQMVAAESKSIMVGYRGKDGVSIPVPDKWRQKILAFESDTDFGL
jgi:acyl-CoA thioester hydrolase